MAKRARSEPTRSRGASKRGRKATKKQDFKPVPELDRLVHERIRLGIMSALAVHDSLSFQELKGVLDATDGNLSVHARKLEEAGYLECEKTFVGRMPRTEYRLSDEGREALELYLGHMRDIIQATRL